MQWERNKEESRHFATSNQQVDKEEHIVGDYNRIDDLYGDARKQRHTSSLHYRNTGVYKAWLKNTEVNMLWNTNSILDLLWKTHASQHGAVPNL